MADLTILELLLFQLVLILLNAVFACTEIAVISINEAKLKRVAALGSKSARILLSLTEQSAKFLATIQVGITLSGFLGSAFAADNFSDIIVDWLIAQGVAVSPAKLDVMAVILITLILSYITLIWGELVPKRLAMKYSERIGLFMAYPIYIVAKMFSPIVWFLTVSTNVSLRLLGIDPKDQEEQVTEEEIKTMLDLGTKTGTIDDVENKLINNVFEFDDKVAEDVMRHRINVTFLDFDDDPKKWEKVMIGTRYSVYPVYQGHYDNTIGVMSLKDYFKYRKSDKDIIRTEAIKKALYIPASKHIDDLFAEMQKMRIHFAFVMDEYGGVLGIVTMKDLLRELVGELQDDMSHPDNIPQLKKLNKNSWLVKGNVRLKDIEKELKIDLSDIEYDFFSGFVFSLMENIPTDTKNIKLSYKNIKIKLVKMTGHQIEEAIIQKNRVFTVKGDVK